MTDRAFFYFSLSKDSDPLQFAAALAPLPYTLFFDSADRAHNLAQYSFIAFAPFETIEATDGQITITNIEQQLSFSGDPIETVGERVQSWGQDWQGHPDLPPFQGGAAGCFGYDLARQLEKLPTLNDARAVPDMMVGLYDQVVAFDHSKGRAWFMTHARDEAQARARLTHLLGLVEQAGKQDIAAFHGKINDVRFEAVTPRPVYERGVEKVIEYIRAGDIFQANISQRFEAPLPAGFDHFAHYCHLRAVNAAPFAAFMNFGDIKIASASPERFIAVRNRQVDTRPIKGTRPRSKSPAEDAANIDDLTSSRKERAENAMIVDLLRNDLSKVCEDHSIKVPHLCALESFAKVHHLVSVVTGTLRADLASADALHACFPGGSITGAPKVRAMEIIEEIEAQTGSGRRGPYCGALAYIGFNGAMDSNIVIRTLVYDRDTVCFNVGGGIVADSVPADEYHETLAKARGLLDSFGGDNLEKRYVSADR